MILPCSFCLYEYDDNLIDCEIVNIQSFQKTVNGIVILVTSVEIML